MKKFNLLLSSLTITSLLAFAGCENTTSTSSATSSNNTSTSTITSTEERHTVTFVKNNGEANATRMIRHGKTISMAPEYEKEYYVIENWYTDPECEKEIWNFAVDTVEEDITLYAKWEVDMEDWIWRLARISSKSTIMLFVEHFNSRGISLGAGFGSGMVIAKEEDPVDNVEYYYALTNNHVVAASGNDNNMINFEKRNVHIYDHYQNVYYAEVLAESNKYDLALVRFDTEVDVMSVAGSFADPNYENGQYAIKITEFADEDPEIGYDVCSYGSPIGQQGVKTIGKVSRYAGGCIYEDPNSVSCITDFDVIHHTASILQGNSGGPLFGPDLKLVGVNYGSSGHSDTYETSGDFWAVPISEVRNFIDKFVAEDASYSFLRDL